ncbi:MAG TPA: DnaJ domain-containing protein [Terracidiphilus sp.]|nr:DnaJ domain-containing protein [Terracidiphilus sp.]
MPCVCPQCAQHARTLGLAAPPASRAVLRKAFKATAKLWHPDRFEGDPGKRLEAEEQFKQIQIASRELAEHLENPAAWALEPAFTPSSAPAAPPIFFANAPGCFVAPDFSPIAERIIAAHVHEPDRALAIVDLTGPGSPPGSLSRYILFTVHGIVVRDALNLVSLLWYADLGELRLLDRRRDGRLGLWHTLIERLSRTQQKFTLEIFRGNGTLFHVLASQVDDSVKKVIYNFLQQKKPQPHP